MNAKAQTLGVVIAGGRSVRFGGEKAVALLEGRPLLIRAVERLQTACERVVVNARPSTGAESLARRCGLEVLHDAPGDAAGPLAGVRGALERAHAVGAARIAVSPCDAPLLPDDLFARLLAAAGDGAAMAETAEGRQPLCAVWPVTALPKVVEALEGGAHPPTWRLLLDVGAVVVRFDRADDFVNVNTRADLDAVAVRHQR
jgi:molybdopterin-guanine dinucleotide biosynthesis protein A